MDSPTFLMDDDSEIEMNKCPGFPLLCREELFAYVKPNHHDLSYPRMRKRKEKKLIKSCLCSTLIGNLCPSNLFQESRES